MSKQGILFFYTKPKKNDAIPYFDIPSVNIVIYLWALSSSIGHEDCSILLPRSDQL